MCANQQKNHPYYADKVFDGLFWTCTNCKQIFHLLQHTYKCPNCKTEVKLDELIRYPIICTFQSPRLKTLGVMGGRKWEGYECLLTSHVTGGTAGGLGQTITQHSPCMIWLCPIFDLPIRMKEGRIK